MAQGFSKSHIEKILWDTYELYLIDEHAWEYKGYRYRRYHTYMVVDASENVIMRGITLKALADYLKAEGEY